MKRQWICTICAERPTVRSHIIPRALFHDTRRPGRTMILSGREPGYKVTQSGKWDSRILCVRHEGELGACDDYAVSLCRQYRALVPDGGTRTLANASPDLLVDFATACIWRMAGALSYGKPGRVMGEYADLVEGRLFGPGGTCDPALFLEGFRVNDGKGAPLVFGLLPAPLDPARTRWHFIVSDIRFLVDFRQGSDAADAVNQAREVRILDPGLRPVDDVPGLTGAFLRMSMPRPSRRRV